MFCFNCNEKLVEEQRVCPDCGDVAVQEETIDESYIKTLTKVAESGDAASCLKLGRCYEHGFGVKFSFKKALYWYREANEKGYPFADIFKYKFVDNKFCFNCNERVYEDVKFCPKCENLLVHESTFDESYIETLTKAAESGDVASCIKLGQCYEHGFAVEESREETYHWYKEAVKKRSLETDKISLPFVKEFVESFEHEIEWEFLDKAKSLEEVGDYEGAFKVYMEVVEEELFWPFETYLKIAKCYAEGRGVEQDIDKAIFWCSQGGSGYYLAILYLKKGKQREAFELMLKSAQTDACRSGSYYFPADSAYYLGHFYSAGIGVEKNDEEALKWYLKAYLIRNYYDTVNWMLKRIRGTAEELGINWSDEVGFPWYLKFAQSGDADWQEEVARRYEKGIGVEKNDGEAFYWKLQSAKKGNVEPQYKTGYCYENGIGVEKNIAKAFFWYRKAAEKGHAKAQLAIGLFYAKGIGVKQTPEQAFYWIHKSSQSEKSAVEYYLGHLYSAGIGVEKNDEEALKWYLKAYDYSSGLSQNLSRMEQTAQELGVDWSDEVAFSWYLKFAQSGNPFLQEEVARRYEAAQGLENEKTAFFWYREAADKGLASAQSALGRFYEEGIGTKKDRELALQWYQKAAEQGDEFAKKRICFL